jgi:hypothetical protein
VPGEEGANAFDSGFDSGSGAGDSTNGGDTGGVETGRTAGFADSVSSGTGCARLICGVTSGGLGGFSLLNGSGGSGTAGTVFGGAPALEAAGLGSTAAALLLLLEPADL